MAQDDNSSVQTDISADLNAAVTETETEDSSPEEEVEEAEAEATGKSKPKKGAQTRIRDLLSMKDNLESVIEELTGKVNFKDKEIEKLIEQVDSREKDRVTIAKINQLYQDVPELRPYLEGLDKAIQDQEYTLPGMEAKDKAVSKETESEALAKAQELVRQAKAEMDESLTSQRDELILHKADLLTDAYIDQLPEQYNDEDKEILRSVLVDHIDWDTVDGNPEALPEVIAEGFQSVLDWYKTPKGANATVPQGEESEVHRAEPITKEKLDAFAKQDWAKLKTVKTPDGKEMQVPEVSDEDFNKSLAQMMRELRKLSE